MLRLTLVVLFGIGAMLSPTILAAARGDLDPTFGSGGKVTTDFGASETGSAVTVQRNRRIVVAGDRSGPETFTAFVLARYTPNGNLDPSFNGNGKVTTDFSHGYAEAALDVEVQRDARIVAAGYASQAFALARYRTDGRLDPSFGEGGKVQTRFQRGSYHSASAVLLQPDGKIVAGGGTRGSALWDSALARYLPDGTLDPTFGDGGRVITQISSETDHFFDLALQPDGKIVAAGWSFADGPHIALARYDRDGRLDTSFDGDGIVVTTFRGAAAQLLVQRDGKLLVAGLGEITRFNRDGSLDRSFGEGGRARAGNVAATTAAIQPDGKILVIGTVSSGAVDGDFGVARLTTDGKLDNAYGRGGRILTDFSSGSDDQPLDAVLLPDGKLVVSGMSNPRPAAGVWGPWDFAVARYIAIRFCVVPNLRGKTLRAARSSLTTASCRVGTIKRAYSAKARKGRVVWQRPVPGMRLAELAKVDLVVSRGPRR